MLHSKCVYVIAKEINSRIEEQTDEKMIEYATMMHDAIKLIDSSYKHSIKSSRLLKDLTGERFFEEALTEIELHKIARAITLHNKREKIYKGTRYTEEERLACILHDADKISKIFKKSSWKKKGKYLKVKKYEKVQKKIRKTLLFIESEKLLEEYRRQIISRERDSLRLYKFITLKKDFQPANQPQVVKASARIQA
ncbi:HD domain-containing protein [Saccharibacillus kuerlensis]|nr:HD domain-containing protein [Saccharibacillus kuerlensis]